MILGGGADNWFVLRCWATVDRIGSEFRHDESKGIYPKYVPFRCYLKGNLVRAAER